MLDGEKNLNDLLFFAQSLIKDIELKKKEVAQQDQDENPNDKSPTRPNLTSFKAERDKALRYKEWKRSFCEEGSSRDRLARSVDRLNEVEAEWTNQKRVYQHKAMNMSLYSDAQLFTELECSPQKKSSRCGSVRGSRWDEKPSPSKNSYSSLNRMQKAYYSRSSSQGCMDKESASKQNSGTKETGNSKAFKQRKGSIGTPKNNDSMQRTNSYQSLHSSQKKVETPVSKSKTIFGDSSPNKKDYLKRKSYSIQRQISLEAGNPSASTNFSASTINSARQQNESISAVDNKFESLFMSGKGEEPKRGRQASPKRGIPSTTGTESPVVPIVSKINLGDWSKHSIELKEKSHRGYKEQNDSSSIWSSEKLIMSLKARAGLGDVPQPQSNLTNLKELFPADSKPSARTQAAGDTTEEGSASPSKSVNYSILKEKPQLNDSREINSSRRLNNSCRSETKKPSRSSSCHQDKEQPSSARNRNKSPVSSRDKIASLQVQEDLKLLESNKSIEKWKKSRETNKEITCEVIDLRAEKEKLYKDILDKLHSQKQKSKGKSKQIWLY